MFYYVRYTDMKKTTKKPKVAAAKAAQPEPSSNKLPITMVMRDMPPPEHLLELAQSETNRRELEEYIEVIQLLRNDKSFSFREIAEWLNEKGVETDHNAVYRAYRNNLPPEVVEEFERDVALEEHDEEERR